MGQKSRTDRADVAIAGAGAAGLSLAAALAQALRPGFVVVVSDPALAREPAQDDRVSAIAPAARRLLTAIGAWERLSEPPQPIVAMEITDSRLDDVMRPTFLSFGEGAGEGEPLAHMAENRAVLIALRAVAQEAGVRFETAAVENFTADDDGIDVQLAGGDAIHARLLVAADGSRSKLRTLAGIKTVNWSYGQSGIVATIGHERDHEGRATQHFLASGPFAILPLSGRRSSIVWNEPPEEAARLVALPADAFHAELEKRFGLKLGEIEVLSPPRAYPLGFSIARSFVADRLALVGDAAHLVHPIAGQGLNLGLRDVAALAECVAEAARLGLDIGAPDVLARYERWRRFDTTAMGFSMDTLNRLFSNRSDALRLLRDLGLGIVERAPRLKQFFAAEAAGAAGKVPRLLRGEAL
ncbi:MAG: ubiquinone biosynthesis hydroxylase [Bradyrhizobiaceae bacterium]|nr:ubiquinone biosynthesis hydroxylase [Bradyrhizobiaceae bacterium]